MAAIAESNGIATLGLSRSPRRDRALHTLGLIAVCIFAYVLCYEAGQRGFFMTDQSFVFDGGYRIYSGQVPYRDFLIPWGPVALWLQAGAFQLLGVNYGAYLVTAALQNVLGTWLAYRLLRKLFPNSVWLPLAAGAMTAAWYYAPFATPWLEQTGFLFTFVGFNCLASALVENASQPSKLRNAVLFAVCGACTVLTFLSKQNAGVFMPPVYFALIVVGLVPDWRAVVRAGLSYTAGAAIAAAAFACWLWTASDPAQFYPSVWVIPASEGGRRLLDRPLEVAGVLLTGKGPELPRMLLFAAVLAGLAAWRRSWTRASDMERTSPALRLAAALCIALPCYQNFFNKTTEQSGNNGMPFIGIAIACALGLVAEWRRERANDAADREVWLTTKLRLSLLALATLASAVLSTGVPIGGAALAILLAHGARLIDWPWEWIPPQPALRKSNALPRAFFVAATAVSLVLVVLGSSVAWSRKAQHIFSKDCRFPRPLPVARLHELKWGVPTTAHSGKSVTEADLVQLIEYLSAGHKRFFVFPEFTMLYGVLGVESPQPLLWFDSGLTYSAEYDRRLDEWIVSALERNQVDTLVMESATSFEPAPILRDFPLLSAHLRDNFATVRQIGSFEIRERRPGAAFRPHQQLAR